MREGGRPGQWRQTLLECGMGCWGGGGGPGVPPAPRQGPPQASASALVAAPPARPPADPTAITVPLPSTHLAASTKAKALIYLDFIQGPTHVRTGQERERGREAERDRETERQRDRERTRERKRKRERKRARERERLLVAVFSILRELKLFSRATPASSFASGGEPLSALSSHQGATRGAFLGPWRGSQGAPKRCAGRKVGVRRS